MSTKKRKRGTHAKSNAPSLRRAQQTVESARRERVESAPVVNFYEIALDAADPEQGERLRDVAYDVEEITREVFELCGRLVWMTKHDADCRGIAAPQVGAWVRIFTVKDDDKRVWCFVNPSVEARKGALRAREWEGCYSLPDMRAQVERWSSVVVRGLAPSGEKVEMAFSGMTARAVQHEMDHLDGVMIDESGEKFEPVPPGIVGTKRSRARA